MSSLSIREQLLLGSVLAAVLAGVTIKHWRDARREVVVPVAVGQVGIQPAAGRELRPAETFPPARSPHD